MTSEHVFAGVGVALVTLFTPDGELDADATAAHAQRLVAAGVRAVVVAGTTGEAAALEPAERVALVQAVRAAVDVPVLAGTGAPSARQAARLTAEAVALGVDGVLVLAPPYADDVRPYYDTVADAAGSVPVLAYHWPNVSAPGISLTQLPELPVAGLKDSTGDLPRLAATLDCFAGTVYTGSQAALLTAAALGAHGAILGIANAEPELAVRAWAGDADAQREVQRIAVRIKRGLVSGLKEHVAAKFATSPFARMA